MEDFLSHGQTTRTLGHKNLRCLLDLQGRFMNIDRMSAIEKKAPTTKGTKMAAKTRKSANLLSDEERQEALARALTVIYKSGNAAVCAHRS